MDPKLTQAFRSQSMADKTKFISDNLYYASMSALAEHCNAYIFDLLDAVRNPDMIADWLRSKGYTVTFNDNKPSKQ